MGFRKFGNYIQGATTETQSDWKQILTSCLETVIPRENERFCRYDHTVSPDAGRIVSVLSTGLNDELGWFAVDLALQEGKEKLMQYINGSFSDPCPFLIRIAENWKEQMLQNARREGLGWLSDKSLSRYAPDFLAVAATEEEILFVQSGNGEIFVKSEGQAERILPAADIQIRKTAGFAPGSPGFFCRRYRNVPEAVFLISSGYEKYVWSQMDPFLQWENWMLHRTDGEGARRIMEDPKTGRVTFAVAGFRREPEASFSQPRELPKQSQELPAAGRSPYSSVLAGKSCGFPAAGAFSFKQREKRRARLQEEAQRLQARLCEAENEKKQLESRQEMIREQMRRLEKDFQAAVQRMEKNRRYIEQKEARARR